jgi:mannose-6-phosphate isomerase-like protein (cupin superfamily)
MPTSIIRTLRIPQFVRNPSPQVPFVRKMALPDRKLAAAIVSKYPFMDRNELGAMRIVDHAGQEQEQWRPGVLARMRVSAPGSAQLCVFEQWCDPGCGTNLHAVEEVLTVLAGCAEFWVSEECATVTVRQSVIVPATGTAFATPAGRSSTWKRHSRVDVRGRLR